MYDVWVSSFSIHVFNPADLILADCSEWRFSLDMPVVEELEDEQLIRELIIPKKSG